MDAGAWVVAALSGGLQVAASIVVPVYLLRSLVAQVMQLREDIPQANPELQPCMEGWYLLHGDIFRQTKHPTLLASLLALGMSMIVLLCL
jgi:hypothetical protein